MIEKLEEIKKLGNYAIVIYFGEDIGCDDMDEQTNERNLKVLMTPVGCLGSSRKLWKGKYKDFLKFNFNCEPKKISNPPKSEEIQNDGFYIWSA